MTKPLLSLLALLLGTAAHGQAPLVLTQSNFPALPTSVDIYRDLAAAGLTPPAPGANQAWNYGGATLGGSQHQRPYLAPPAPAAFPTATRAYRYALPLNALVITGTGYEELSATGLRRLGSALATQRFSLTPLTGGALDSLVVPAQTLPTGIQLVLFPLTAGSLNRFTTRTVSMTLLTVQAYGLTRVPLRYVQRETRTDSVAGWGTVRVPALSGGGTAPVPALLVRSRYVGTDSIYLGNQPAPAALLAALGVPQGAVTRQYTDLFYRSGSGQSLLELYYPNSRYQLVVGAAVSGEAGLVTAARPTQATRLSSLQAFPNPSRDGQLTLVAADGTRPVLRLTVRDVLGCCRATGSTISGQPSAILRGLPAGTYLLEAQAPDGPAGTLRVAVE